jgi:hypothetical protein
MEELIGEAGVFIHGSRVSAERRWIIDVGG